MRADRFKRPRPRRPRGKAAARVARSEFRILMEESQEILLVHNPRSRRGRKAARSVRDVLHRAGLYRRARWIEIGELERRPPSPPFPCRAIAVGGDGTVNALAAWVLGIGRSPESGPPAGAASTVLGIVPGGTGNNLARELGLPLDPERAAAVALSGRAVRRIDGVRYLPLDGGDPGGSPRARLLVQGGQLGFPARINARFHELREKRLFRTAAYPFGFLIYRILGLAGLYGVRRRERRGDTGDRLAVRAAFPGEEIEAEALAVFVGNGSSLGGGFQPCPRALPDDGLMDLCLIRAGTGHSYLGLFREVLRGRHHLRGDVEYRQTPGPLELCFDRPSQFLADGDIWVSARSYRLEILPRALSFSVGP